MNTHIADVPATQTPIEQLDSEGWAIVRPDLAERELMALAEVFRPGLAGERCLLDREPVRRAAIDLRRGLVRAGLLPNEAVAIQAIAFDKTGERNWKVAWHQDTMFPFAQPPAALGYELATFKDGVNYARPPRAVLETLLAVRLHIDECHVSNGPLRIVPGSHRAGLTPAAGVAEVVARLGVRTVLAAAGDTLLMKPLLLHASSAAREPVHRRVLHFVFAAGEPPGVEWFRAIR